MADSDSILAHSGRCHAAKAEMSKAVAEGLLRCAQMEK